MRAVSQQVSAAFRCLTRISPRRRDPGYASAENAARKLSVVPGMLRAMEHREPAAVIETLWARVEARDWAGLAELVAPDAVIDWPVSAERIAGRDAYVAINQGYPAGWTIRVLRLVAAGDQVASEVEVRHPESGTFRAASFWTVRDGRVVRAAEYWTDHGMEAPAAWRRPHVQPLPPP